MFFSFETLHICGATSPQLTPRFQRRRAVSRIIWLRQSVDNAGVDSLGLPNSAAQLLNDVRKHSPQRQLAFAYEAGAHGDVLGGLFHFMSPCTSCIACASIFILAGRRRTNNLHETGLFP